MLCLGSSACRSSRLRQRATSAGLHYVGGGDLASGHGVGALVGLHGPVGVVGGEREAHLVTGLADLGDRLASGAVVAGTKLA